ncbi:Dual specificity protein phosphatase 4 [Arcticibacter svalbardensis MN12-7]|uniref:Dual specificity protein phosphatase 4 n=1 Tax=Arcticibacter svalbardensis MN12-7 TaxID=1150600 RepID=R9GY28_9SPHI|nr:dual specificity protein phosphatase [Arcticibacter svalbardensis]EOR96697.1 Dual specificity protein phosphatase 4 [Arcticibacter svalbardensis MN12-7]
MLKKVKSLITLVIIFFQKVYDHFYRLIKGIPTIKRSQITADLFLGSQYNKVGLRKLKALGITAIVNMRIHSIYKKAQYKGFEYRHFPTIDNTAPPLEVLIKGAQFIDEQIKKNGKVYVHCRQGLGRGPTMAIAYLLKSGLTFDDALGLVKKVRPFINPRRSQIARLKELEQFYNAQVLSNPA